MTCIQTAVVNIGPTCPPACSKYGIAVCGMHVQGATHVRCTELEDNTAAEKLCGPEGIYTP